MLVELQARDHYLIVILLCTSYKNWFIDYLIVVSGGTKVPKGRQGWNFLALCVCVLTLVTRLELKPKDPWRQPRGPYK